MPFIDWVPGYEIGNEAVDAQHRRLAALVNTLHDAAITGEALQKLRPALTELVGYVHAHFDHEEALAARYAPDQYPLQRSAHQRWIKRIKDVLCVSGTDSKRAAFELTALVKSWLIKHVLVMDKRLATYLPAEIEEESAAA